VTIPNSVTSIGEYAFYNCGDAEIIFDGSKEEWKKIYNRHTFESTYFICHCTDGDIIKRKRK
jgi:hypothetical protein